jgi:hypothetical protein
MGSQKGIRSKNEEKAAKETHYHDVRIISVEYVSQPRALEDVVPFSLITTLSFTCE